jgi:hypothetical protein
VGLQDDAVERIQVVEWVDRPGGAPVEGHMLTTLAALSLACMPVPKPLLTVAPTTSRCEGPDLVVRDHDHREVSRRPGACIVTSCEGADLVSRESASRVEYRRQRFSPSCVTSQCEGADLVRRDASGIVYSRASFSPACMTSRCEGNDLVSRDSRGFELSRQAFRCGPPPPVRLVQSDAWRFGLTAK